MVKKVWYIYAAFKPGLFDKFWKYKMAIKNFPSVIDKESSLNMCSKI